MEEQLRTDPQTNSSPHLLCNHLKRISWNAILSGAFVGIGSSFLLNLFCVGLGLSAFSATQDGVTVLAIGGFMGLVISAFISMFAAGWVAGYIGRPFALRRHLGELYGFITWSVTLVLMVLLASHAGKFVSNFNDTMILSRPGTTILNTTTNEAPPLVTQNTVTNPSTGNTTTQATVNVEKATNALGVSTFATFFVFFIGAIGSCFGGATAMRCGRKKLDSDTCSLCHK